MKLALLNTHERDQYVHFDEGPHVYTVKGQGGYTSVTTLNHAYFGEFDANGIITNILKGKKMKDPTYTYYGMSREQIKAIWDKNGKEASTAGTKMHADIENYYNDIPVKNDSVEFAFFKQFLADFPELKPYRTEWVVYDEYLKIAGSIDMVFENPDGTIQIYDWKRVKQIKYDHETSYGNETYGTLPCISHLPDTNYWHYALQLNTYKKLLETNYGKTVTDLFLVCLHPENPLGTYERIRIKSLDKEIDDLFEIRRRVVNKIEK